jgi:hypothetical protein
MKNSLARAAAACVALACGSGLAAAQAGFATNIPAAPALDNLRAPHVALETSPVRPMAISNDGAQLYVINQPGARLAIFDILTLSKLKEIPTGPGVTAIVPLANTNQVWTVDSIANSVAVIDVVSGTTLHSIRVGSEPRSLAFSDSLDRAFVTCAGVDRVDVISVALHSVVNSLPFPAKQPHAVAFSGGKAWVVPMLSGNNTAPRGAAPGALRQRRDRYARSPTFPRSPSARSRPRPILASGAPGSEVLAAVSSRGGNDPVQPAPASRHVDLTPTRSAGDHERELRRRAGGAQPRHGGRRGQPPADDHRPRRTRAAGGCALRAATGLAFDPVRPLV